MSKEIEKLETYTFQKKDDPREEAVELVIAILEAHGAKLNELIEAVNKQQKCIDLITQAPDDHDKAIAERESHDKDD